MEAGHVGASRGQRADVAVRRAKAIQLDLAGVDYERIKEQLGYKDVAHVRQDIHRSLEERLRTQRFQVDLHVQRELDRLERLQAAFWGAAIQGDPKAGDMVLKIMARRAKTLGTDSALKVEITTIDQIDAEIQALRAQMALDDATQQPAIEA
jgi:hypothetical protein